MEDKKPEEKPNSFVAGRPSIGAPSLGIVEKKPERDASAPELSENEKKPE